MIDPIAVHPEHARRTDDQRYGARPSRLLPTDTSVLLGVQPRKIGLGENHLVEQTLGKAFVPLPSTGQIETSQPLDALIAMGAERHLDKQA